MGRGGPRRISVLRASAPSERGSTSRGDTRAASPERGGPNQRFTASLRGRNRNNDLDQVLDEVEDLVGHARRRGLVPVPIFFADDEFNLPGEDHAIAMLEGLVKRRLERYVQWRAYFNPVPFSP